MTVKIETVEIGPERALELLKHNDRNRPMDFSLVATYERQMSAGKWTFVGDPIRVSTTGRLLDGQNRLMAIVQSGTEQEFVLITGLPDDTQPFMDIGKKRSYADVFAMYEIPGAHRAAAITQLLIRFEMRNMLDTKFKLTTSELLEYYQAGDNPQRINKATTVSDRLIKYIPLSPAVAGTVHVAASRISDPFAVNEFFDGLVEGFGLAEGNPIAALRNWVIRRKREDLRVNRNEYFFLLARTWNSWVQREEIFRVQLPKGGLQSSDQIPLLKPAGPPEKRPVTEDNPVVLPRGLSAKERDQQRNGGKRAS